MAKEEARLGDTYFTGGREDARRSIQEYARLLEGTSLLPQYQEGQAFVLFLSYARLYALERRAGNNDTAHIALIRARYWFLRSDELHGHSAAECAARVEKFASEDTLIGFIDEWDKKANHGTEPRYIHQP